MNPIITNVVLFISTVAILVLGIAVDRWRNRAREHKTTIAGYEADQQSQRLLYESRTRERDLFHEELQKALAERNQALSEANAVRAEREDMEKRLTVLRQQCDEHNEQSDESETRLIEARQEIETLKAELAKVADDRFSEVAKRTKCELQLHTIGRERNEALLKCDSYLKANENLLQKLNEATDQLDAVRNAIAVRPEPTE